MRSSTSTTNVRKANPDDPPTHRPPLGPSGPMPGPHFLGLEGRIAIVQAQVFLLLGGACLDRRADGAAVGASLAPYQFRWLVGA